MPRKPARRLSPRTSVPLSGTTLRTSAQLDFDSQLALDYCTAWVQRELGLSVPTSGVIRRALGFYAAHLATVPNGLSEACVVRRVCGGRMVPPEAQLEAQLRLAAVAPDEPMPPFSHVAVGPAKAKELAAFEGRVDALVDAVAQSKWGRLRGISPSNKDKP